MKKLSFPTSKEQKAIEKFVTKRQNKNLAELEKDALTWTRTAWGNKMDYEVSWFGIPIIQNPYDMVLMQELIFNLRPDIIIETGIAHGGSIIFYASLLRLLGKGKVIGVDIDIRAHNKKLLEKHPFIDTIAMYEGSSTDPKIVNKIKKDIKQDDIVLVILDSNHLYQHVYDELNIYKDFVSKNSYIVVFDTFMPLLDGLEGAAPDVKENNPMRAIEQLLKEDKNFTIDTNYNKYFVSSCPNGFLKKIS
jgi:cephalosporin hydroxylase